MSLAKVVNDCFTGADNQTYDLGRVSYAAAHIALYGLVIVWCIIKTPPTLMDLASAESTITVAYAIHLGLKKDTEPRQR